MCCLHVKESDLRSAGNQERNTIHSKQCDVLCRYLTKEDIAVCPPGVEEPGPEKKQRKKSSSL